MVESKFDSFALGAYKLTGTLNTQVSIDADFTEASFSGATTIADFPHSLSPIALQLAKGNASAKFTGNYSIANKTVRVKEFSLQSHLGKGNGAGEITFAAASANRQCQDHSARAAGGISQVALCPRPCIIGPTKATPNSIWTCKARGMRW
jgi:hypothetical protein